MLDLFRKSLCVVLAWLLIVTTAAPAQQPSPATAAPVPPQILSAHAVFVSNGGGSNYFDTFTGGPDRAYNTLYAVLQQSNSYELVSAPAKADLIFNIRGMAPTVGYGDDVGNNPQLILSVTDPKTSAVLWTTSANVRAFGRQKSRDQEFDQCVAVLVDKLGQVTGRTLSTTQIQAVKDNSRMHMPTGAKVLLIVGIAATAGFAIYGAYRVSHPPSLPPLPTPALP